MVAGCGSKAASTTGVTPTPSPTPLPSALVTYASNVTATLKTSIAAVDHMRREMSTSGDMEAVAYDCGQVGTLLSTDSSSFATVSPPAQARGYFASAQRGYNAALTASTDCSTAADARSKLDLRAAISEFASALSNLASAQHGIAAWSPRT
jgi:hypothetical protein